MRLRKLTLSDVADQLDRPGEMATLARVGDMLVSAFNCHGLVNWHKHVDYDELFWVYRGSILIESELGSVALRANELALVPKGVGHRSGSPSPALVILIYCGFLVERKNGKRRVHATADQGKLTRIDLSDASANAGLPMVWQPVVSFDGSVLSVARGEGAWPMPSPAPHDLLLMPLQGTATVLVEGDFAHLHPGDLGVIARGETSHLTTSRNALMVMLSGE